MDKSIAQMYEEMINSSGIGNDEFDDDLGMFGDSSSSLLLDYSDEVEEFITSKEVVEKKKELAEHFGTAVEDAPIEEEIHFKIYSKKHVHKYTDKEMEEIRKSCETTIVHDFSEHDFFHMSDEERAENDMLSEMGVALGSLHRIYRKPDEYVEAMRVVVKAWEMLEEKGNYLHSSDEFFKLVAAGKIVSNRIIMPKLKKADRYNQEVLIEYISNPDLDPSKLAVKKEEKHDFDLYDDFYVDIESLVETDGSIAYYYNEFYDGDPYQEFIEEYKAENNISDDEFDESDSDFRDDARTRCIEYIREQKKLDEIESLLSPEQLEYIEQHMNDPESFEVQMIDSKYLKGYDRRSFFSKSKRKGKKKDRYIVESLHEMLNKIQTNPNFQKEDVTKSYMITNSMFDTSKEQKDVWDGLRFDGSWADADATFLYDIALREEFLKLHTKQNESATYGDVELARFFEILEKAGVDVLELRRKMNCTSDDLKREENKRTKKENRKIESQLLDRIEKLNESNKFKKMVAKAEKALNEGNQEE